MYGDVSTEKIVREVAWNTVRRVELASSVQPPQPTPTKKGCPCGGRWGSLTSNTVSRTGDKCV